MTDRPTISTLGELRASGHVAKALREEIRDNLLTALADGRDPWPGLHGFESTVIPQLERALIAGHDVVLLGERGQGKSRLLRTLVGLLAGDPRAMMARGSWVTAIVGLWIIGSLWASRPFLFTATTPFMPAPAAQEWEQSWATEPRFRRVLRVMTLAFGVAFLLDAAARVVMAYTLPLDLVPVLSSALLLVALVVIVVAGRSYGRYLRPVPEGTP